MSSVNDSLQNLVSGLGMPRDKSASTTYGFSALDDAQLHNAYTSAWLPRKIIEVPALDATRRWRRWQCDAAVVTLLENEEKRLGLQSRLRQALRKARLWGGAAIYLGTRDTDPSKPLNVQAMGKGSLLYLTVLTRRQLTVSRLDDNPLSPGFMRPLEYHFSVGSTSTLVHASRIVRLIGAEPADEELQTGQSYGWGDPVLQAIYDAVRNADATAANVASMVFEGKLDVIKIPDFMAQMNDEQYRDRVIKRMTLAMAAKGINGALLLDKDEDHSLKQLTFSALPDVVQTFLQLVAGAADIPLARLLGQSPSGLNATGDTDIRNYYDRISAYQELELRPALNMLDEALIRSATGQRDPSIWYEWASLWQTTDKERAEIGKLTADTVKTLNDTGLIPQDVLSQAAINALADSGALPGIDTPSDGSEEEEEEDALLQVGDAKPTSAMQAEARRGLEWRKEFNRGGTGVGVARARDISNGADLSDDTVGRMVSYFARHEVDKKGKGWSQGEPGYPSAGRIAWALWGGDPGRAWANARWKQIQKERGE